jgi:hypothetical protein
MGGKKLRGVLQHIEDVRRDTALLGERLIELGGVNEDYGRDLIARGLRHDNSKLYGLEWDCLGSDDKEMHRKAWAYHVSKNDHHPEFWPGGVHGMPDVCVAEMVCDWHARSSEFGTDLVTWIESNAMPRFKFSLGDRVFQLITQYVNLLLEEPFR